MEKKLTDFGVPADIQSMADTLNVLRVFRSAETPEGYANQIILNSEPKFGEVPLADSFSIPLTIEDMVEILDALRDFPFAMKARDFAQKIMANSYPRDQVLPVLQMGHMKKIFDCPELSQDDNPATAELLRSALDMRTAIMAQLNPLVSRELAHKMLRAAVGYDKLDLAPYRPK